jgi:hypothetical protein
VRFWLNGLGIVKKCVDSLPELREKPCPDDLQQNNPVYGSGFSLIAG